MADRFLPLERWSAAHEGPQKLGIIRAAVAPKPGALLRWGRRIPGAAPFPTLNGAPPAARGCHRGATCGRTPRPAGKPAINTACSVSSGDTQGVRRRGRACAFSSLIRVLRPLPEGLLPRTLLRPEQGSSGEARENRQKTVQRAPGSGTLIDINVTYSFGHCT